MLETTETPIMIRTLAVLATTALFASATAADTLTMPSPADGFPNGWDKVAEATCTPRENHTLISSVFMMMDHEGFVRNVVQLKKNGKVVVQFRRLFKDGEIIGGDGTILHSGRIENFASNVPGSFEKMQAAMLTALEVSVEEYLSCAHAASPSQQN